MASLQKFSGEAVRPPLGLWRTKNGIRDLIDNLGFTPDEAAEVVGESPELIREIYWAGRFPPGKRSRWRIIRELVPGLDPRDYAALELTTVLGYSLRQAAKVVGLNFGHLSRRLHAVSERLADDRVKAALLATSWRNGFAEDDD